MDKKEFGKHTPAHGGSVSGRACYRCKAGRENVSILRHLYPQASYLSLDLPSNAEAANTAPEKLLSQHREPVIIDEIQYAPSLLRHLKYRIDENRSPGRYLLTGSQVFPLMQGVSESLAGRCAVLNLHTLSRAELLDAGHLAEETSMSFWADTRNCISGPRLICGFPPTLQPIWSGMFATFCGSIYRILIEHPGKEDAAGLRALAESEKKGEGHKKGHSVPHKSHI